MSFLYHFLFSDNIAVIFPQMQLRISTCGVWALVLEPFVHSVPEVTAFVYSAFGCWALLKIEQINKNGIMYGNRTKLNEILFAQTDLFELEPLHRKFSSAILDRSTCLVLFVAQHKFFVSHRWAEFPPFFRVWKMKRWITILFDHFLFKIKTKSLPF